MHELWKMNLFDRFTLIHAALAVIRHQIGYWNENDNERQDIPLEDESVMNLCYSKVVYVPKALPFHRSMHGES